MIKNESVHRYCELTFSTLLLLSTVSIFPLVGVALVVLGGSAVAGHGLGAGGPAHEHHQVAGTRVGNVHLAAVAVDGATARVSSWILLRVENGRGHTREDGRGCSRRP